MDRELIQALTARRGHFRLESGHHGDLWLDPDAFLLRPATVRPFAVELAHRLAAHGIDAVCGPLSGGAFVAQTIAAELGIAFLHAERIATGRAGLFPIDYRLPEPLRRHAAGARVAVVDDAVNAGSALRATVVDLESCGAEIVALGALLTLGGAASSCVAARSLPLERIGNLESGLWMPDACPLCEAGVGLDVAVG
ncbi:MAG: orotate phosphoribosyltransferase [Thermomicrobiales bacterium]